MGQKFTEVSQNLKKSMQNPQKRKAWQSVIGMSIFALFVLSSVIVNRSVQALNQAAGSYGYYSGGAYGYQASTTSSDAPPAAPTAFAASSIATTSATISWTLPTTTTAGSLIAGGSPVVGSLVRSFINYDTSSVTSCRQVTSFAEVIVTVPANSTTSSTTLTGLTANTTYNVSGCVEDNNLNNSPAGTVSFTTLAVTGGNAAVGVGGGGAGSTGPTFPTATSSTTPAAPGTAAAAVPTAVERVAEVNRSAAKFGVTLSTAQTNVAANYVAGIGVSQVSVKLGSGERLAVVGDALETLGVRGMAPAVLEALASGQKPPVRDLTKERAQVAQVREVFRKLMGRDPNFKNVKEDLGYNTLVYRVRFARDLSKERTGIAKFRATFKKIPKSALDWAAVRAWAYALR